MSTVMDRVFEQTKMAYLLTDTDLVVREVVGEASILCHYGPNCVGKKLPECVPELIGHESETEAILEGRRSEFCLSMVNRELADGSIAYLTFTNLPHIDAAGEITGLLHIVEDISDRAYIEQAVTQQRNELYLLRDQLNAKNMELATANTELRTLDEMKSKFVSVAAHELRSPLAAIAGYVELLGDDEFGQISEQQTRFLTVVRRSTVRLLGIVNNLLDATRIETGRLELNLVSKDVMEVVDAVINEQMPQISAKQQSIKLSVGQDVPLVLCDEMRAVQILTNLVSNASKYTLEKGTITIGIDPLPDEGVVRIAVQDNGIGIPVEDQANLFESFYRASNVYHTGASGTGLGLNIARSLVELHGGDIWFESESGVGSTFYFTLSIDSS